MLHNTQKYTHTRQIHSNQNRAHSLAGIYVAHALLNALSCMRIHSLLGFEHNKLKRHHASEHIYYWSRTRYAERGLPFRACELSLPSLRSTEDRHTRLTFLIIRLNACGAGRRLCLSCTMRTRTARWLKPNGKHAQIDFVRPASGCVVLLLFTLTGLCDLFLRMPVRCESHTPENPTAFSAMTIRNAESCDCRTNININAPS